MASIIFDFDGTIVDNRDYIINYLAKKADKTPLSAYERHALYGLSILAIAKRLKISWWRLPGLLYRGRSDMGQVIRKLKPYHDIAQVIKKLHHEGHQIFIVSSNSVRNIKIFLSLNKMIEEVMAIYGGIEVFGKAMVINDLIKDFNLDKKDIICVGDEIRDVEAAKSLDLKTVGVTWGFSSSEAFKKKQPDFIATSTAELMSILEDV